FHERLAATVVPNWEPPTAAANIDLSLAERLANPNPAAGWAEKVVAPPARVEAMVPRETLVPQGSPGPFPAPPYSTSTRTKLRALRGLSVWCQARQLVLVPAALLAF